jgi:hypothetical protein
MAGELDVDLVEIAATAIPPVCRLMDYGKFKYQEQKKAAEAKAKQTVIEIKEVKFRPGVFSATETSARLPCGSVAARSPTRSWVWLFSTAFETTWPT